MAGTGSPERISGSIANFFLTSSLRGYFLTMTLWITGLFFAPRPDCSSSSPGPCHSSSPEKLSSASPLVRWSGVITEGVILLISMSQSPPIPHLANWIVPSFSSLLPNSSTATILTRFSHTLGTPYAAPVWLPPVTVVVPGGAVVGCGDGRSDCCVRSYCDVWETMSCVRNTSSSNSPFLSVFVV